MTSLREQVEVIEKRCQAAHEQRKTCWCHEDTPKLIAKLKQMVEALERTNRHLNGGCSCRDGVWCNVKVPVIVSLAPLPTEG